MRDLKLEAPSHAVPQILHHQKLCDVISVGCFKLLNFGVIFYRPLDNSVGRSLVHSRHLKKVGVAEQKQWFLHLRVLTNCFMHVPKMQISGTHMERA